MVLPRKDPGSGRHPLFRCDTTSLAAFTQCGKLNSMATNTRRRTSLRLPEFRYEDPGAYFVTICTAARRPLFGVVTDDCVVLNEYGRVVETEWRKSFQLRDTVMPDEQIVMPDHIHAIVWFTRPYTVGAGSGPPSRSQTSTRFDPHQVSQNLSALVRDFKGAVTRRLAGRAVRTGNSVWQRGFYDRIIRSERELNAVREFIRYNVMKCRM